MQVLKSNISSVVLVSAAGFERTMPLSSFFHTSARFTMGAPDRSVEASSLAVTSEVPRLMIVSVSSSLSDGAAIRFNQAPYGRDYTLAPYSSSCHFGISA